MNGGPELVALVSVLDIHHDDGELLFKWGRRGRERERAWGLPEKHWPPAGHSVIHKMRPFYSPPSTLAFMLLWRSSVGVKMETSRRVLRTSILKVLSLGGLCPPWDVDVLLTETQPDNLFCLDGFIMFTDVLSLWKKQPFSPSREAIFNPVKSTGIWLPLACPKALWKPLGRENGGWGWRCGFGCV